MRAKTLYVDGYNILENWKSLEEARKASLEEGREKLVGLLQEYISYSGWKVVLVFDAYNLKGVENIEHRGRLTVVYTKERETADSYIERMVANYEGKDEIIVATSDALEQITILGKGATRMSAPELEARLTEAHKMYRLRRKRAHLPFEEKILDEDLADALIANLKEREDHRKTP